MTNNTRDNNEVFTSSQAANAGFATRNVMKDDFGFEIPVETIPLPSKGLVYPANSALHMKETVEIRAMTAREEDILTSRALIKKGTVITELIKSCLIDKDIDVHEMISGDRNAVMTALRITGYGSDYNAEVDCPACGERSKQEFNLSELPIKRLDLQPVAPGANIFEFTLPVTKKSISFRFLDGKDEQDMTITAERRKKQGIKNDNLVTQRLERSIVAIEGIQDRNKISMFIRNMPARDSLTLRRFLDDNEPGIEMKSWLDCPHCDTSSEVRLPMGASFFWPDTE